MRKFQASGIEQVQNVGNGLITASPLVIKNPVVTSDHRAGPKSAQKRNAKPLHSNSGYLQTIPKSPSRNNIAMQLPMYEVYMRCVTWSRDSHGLFDYESKNIAKKNIKTQTGGKILRVNDDVEFVSIRTKPEDLE